MYWWYITTVHNIGEWEKIPSLVPSIYFQYVKYQWVWRYWVKSWIWILTTKILLIFCDILFIYCWHWQCIVLSKRTLAMYCKSLFSYFVIDHPFTSLPKLTSSKSLLVCYLVICLKAFYVWRMWVPLGILYVDISYYKWHMSSFWYFICGHLLVLC